MFCQKCGKQIADDARFCDGCGAAVKRSQSGQERPKQQAKKPSLKSCLKLIVIGFAAIVFVIYCITGLSIGEMIDVLMGNRDSGSQIVRDVERALNERADSISIYKSEWDEELGNWDDAPDLLRDWIAQDPERYYVDWRNSEICYYQNNGEIVRYQVELAYFSELDNDQTCQKIESAANQILNQIPAGASDWDKAKYIHDALIRSVTYQENDYDQTIYGALVEGKAVCNGYAMAYEYLLNKAGIPCDTVAGYSSELSAVSGNLNHAFGLGADAHAWNVATFDGTSYCIDVTWDDPDLQTASGEDYILYTWFCVTQEDMEAEGRSSLNAIYDLEQYDFSSNAMNYYYHTNSVVAEYNRDQIVQIMSQQKAEGCNVLSVRMPDMDAYYSVLHNIEDDTERNELANALGLGRYAYSFTYDYVGDGILCLNIYLDYPQT